MTHVRSGVTDDIFCAGKRSVQAGTQTVHVVCARRSSPRLHAERFQAFYTRSDQIARFIIKC